MGNVKAKFRGVCSKAEIADMVKSMEEEEFDAILQNEAV